MGLRWIFNPTCHSAINRNRLCDHHPINLKLSDRARPLAAIHCTTTDEKTEMI
jgi:hypothetical protein